MGIGPFKIVYNSDLIVRDRSEAACLCVFYDQVFLPCLRRHRHEFPPSALPGVRDPYLGRSDIERWNIEYGTLFDAGVLSRLPLPESERDISQEEVSAILSMPVRSIRAGDRYYMEPALAAHLARTDIDLPQIFTTRPGQPIGRDILVALEAKATFSYLLPKLHIYHPTQILELREKVTSTREGFTMHLWKLSKGLEERAKEHSSVREIGAFAKNLIETDLIPDYREFHRQLAASKAGKWQKVLDTAGKIVEIDAAPWTPKFYGQLLKALGLSAITAASEREEILSNKYQAFKFMSEVEEAKYEG